MDVDIISMSWTFEMKEAAEDDSEKKHFKSLVAEAVGKGLILLASVMDKDSTYQTKDYAPVSFDGVIRICSSDVYGTISGENKYAKPDFLLPGRQLKLPFGRKATGSSFSTAYAAGLAALVLYCLDAHVKLADGDKVAERRREQARSCKGMRAIFKTFSKDQSDNKDEGLFMRPYTILKGKFGKSEEELARAASEIAEAMIPLSTM